MQLLSATKFVESKISTNRPKQKIYEIGSMGEFFLKYAQRGSFFSSKIGSKGVFFFLKKLRSFLKE